MQNTPGFDQAVKSYSLKCKKEGSIFMQPSEELTAIGRKYVHLANVNGPIAKFDFKRARFV